MSQFGNPLFSSNPNTDNNGLPDTPCVNLPGENGQTGLFQATGIEQINSGKYVSVQNVAARLARNVKNKEFDIYDVAEWCAECEVDEIGMYEGFAKYRGVKVQVKHNKAYLPCNIYRLLSVHRNKCSIPKYHWDGAYLRFNLDDPRTFNESYEVEIDYLGIMVDEQGFPLILDGHQEACYWYILTKIYFEDYMNKLIDESRWTTINMKFGDYVQKAKTSFRHVSRDDMNEIQRIMHNIVPKVKMSRNVD